MIYLKKIINRISLFYRRYIIHNWGIDKDLCRELFDLVGKQTKDCEDSIGTKSIYVEISWIGLAGDTLKKLELARELRCKTNKNVVVLCDKRRNQLTQLIKRYNFDAFWESQYLRKYPIECLKALLAAIKMKCSIKSGEELLKYHSMGVLIGDCIYDHILRQSPDYTIHKLSWRRDFPVFLRGMIYLNCIEKQFEKFKPEYYIVGDFCYLFGIYTRMAQKYGAKLYECIVSRKIVEIPHLAGDREPVEHDLIKHYIELKRHKEDICTLEINQKVEILLHEKFLGKGNKDTVCAFANKKYIGVDEFKKELGLNPHKKNAIIMCHCFSDNAHSSSYMVYSDYYDWLEATLKLISKINNVNWIIRAHPSRKLYGETTEVWELFQKYKSNSMFYFPEEFSGEMVREIADVIVTVQGTAGYEYACLGIPVVLTGKAFYSGYGYTIDIDTKDKYEIVLNRLNYIEKLNVNQINQAKEIYYFREGLFSIANPLEKIFWENYKNFLLERDMEKWNNEMVREYSLYLKQEMEGGFLSAFEDC